MRAAIAAVAVLLMPALRTAADEAPMPGHETMHDSMHDMMHMKAAAADDPPITITINPEARLSVALGGALPPTAACGVPIDLSVKIVNEGYVTAQLDPELVGAAPEGVRLSMEAEPLKGLPEEFRQLHIVLGHPGPTDLTIAFKAHAEVLNFGGLDRVHVLLYCR